MTKHNARNERIKRKYFAYLKEAQRYSEPSVDAAAKAISRFEEHSRFRDFKAFHFEQAVAFKRHLAEGTAVRSGERLSKATLHATLTQLRKFFFWLPDQIGYKGLSYSDADYFNLSEKETRIATAHREQRSQRRLSLLEKASDLRWWGWRESTGETRRQFGQSFGVPLRGRGCLTSTLIAFGRRWRGLVNRCASRLNNSRHGAKI